MSATSETLNSLEEHVKFCIMQASNLRKTFILPNMLIYNPEAGNLVDSVQSELAELEEAFKQLHRLAVDRHTYLSTVGVIDSLLHFCLSIHIFVYF